MTKGCNTENKLDIKENPAKVQKERCAISQKRVHHIIATLNTNSVVSKFHELKIIGQGIFDNLIVNK